MPLFLAPAALKPGHITTDGDLITGVAIFKRKVTFPWRFKDGPWIYTEFDQYKYDVSYIDGRTDSLSEDSLLIIQNPNY